MPRKQKLCERQFLPEDSGAEEPKGDLQQEEPQSVPDQEDVVKHEAKRMRLEETSEKEEEFEEFETLHSSAPTHSIHEEVILKEEPKQARQSIPWGAESFDEFLFYCCPECDSKYKDCQSFMDHAMQEHENSNVEINSENDDQGCLEEEEDGDVDPLMDVVENIKQESQDKEVIKVSKPLKCDMCVKTFEKKQFLLYHMRHSHFVGDEVVYLDCEVCEKKKFKSMELLSRHKKICKGP